MIRDIIQYPNEFLLRATNDVTDFTSITGILDDMKETLIHHKALGLASNQINEPFSMFVMKLNNENILEVINPIVIEQTGTQNLNEGCLSLPGEIVTVPRAEQITAQFQDREGKIITGTFYGIEAVCFQHEYDHLLGVFYLTRTNRQQRRRILKNLEK